MLDQLLKQALDDYQRLQSSSIQTIITIKPKCIFDVFFDLCIKYHASPVHNLQDMRQIKSLKAKGDLFELFCVRYLEKIKNYDHVWLLSELTSELKIALRMPLGDKDYGIDLVAKQLVDGQPQYSAVQCKFKSPRPPIQVKTKKGESRTIYPSVNWKELSTFNELCNATGEWQERITMTTAPSVRRLGGIKNSKDVSICLQSFRGLSLEQWRLMLNQPPVKIKIQLKSSIPILKLTESVILTPEQVREKRLMYYQRK